MRDYCDRLGAALIDAPRLNPKRPGVTSVVHEMRASRLTPSSVIEAKVRVHAALPLHYLFGPIPVGARD
jgi:hypothetical protein